MFREFNVKFEDVEMLGGADNLLEGTEITKVIVRGDNNKMSSLDSMLKNCNELDTIDGELDLNGVGDIDNLLEGTELVKSINLKNINNENISANNSFPHVDQINIGGELYSKKAMQNVIASKEWTFDNINYQGTVGDNIVEKEINIVDDNKATIKNTLEQKARGFEVMGQTYENLVVGSGEATLLDELTLESVDGSTKEFNPHLEQPVCVETIEGETYQNLIEGKGEYKLTDTFSATWTESNNSIENPPSMIEIPEIFGNTIQGYANVLTPYVIKEHWKKANWITNATIVNKYTINTTSAPNAINLENAVINDNSLAIQLKANTTYTLKIECPSFGGTSYLRLILEDGSTGDIIVNLAGVKGQTIKKFTTTSTGKITFAIRPDSTSSSKDMKIFCVEGDVDLSLYDFGEFDLEYIQSVGDLYVDESGEPILDEEGNEQYKLEVRSENINLNRNDIEFILPYGKYPEIKLDNTVFKPNVTYEIVVRVISNTLDAELRDFSPNHVCILTGDYMKVSSGVGSTGEFRGLKVCSTEPSRVNNYTFRFDTYNATTGEARIRIAIYERDSLSDTPYIPHESDKTTILLPQPLSRAGYERISPSNGNNNYDLPIRDRLYYDSNSNKFFIQKFVFRDTDINSSFENDISNSSYWRKQVTKNLKINQTYGHIPAIRMTLNSPFGALSAGNTTAQTGYIRLPKSDYPTIEDCNAIAGNVAPYYSYYKNDTELYYEILETKILEKASLETYSPKTYITTNSEIQPSQMTVTNKRNLIDLKKMKANTDYTVQLKCNEKGNKPIKINLCGKEKDVDATIGVNHINITTNELNDNNLKLSGEGNVVSEIIVVEGEMNQYPSYFDGVQNTGELQDDGTYRIGIKTNEGFNISIQTNNPLAKGDKLYWNKSNKRYEIDRGGSIEVPTVSGDIVDLPRLYQKEDTHLTISTGNIKPSKIKVNYLNID